MPHALPRLPLPLRLSLRFIFFAFFITLFFIGQLNNKFDSSICNCIIRIQSSLFPIALPLARLRLSCLAVEEEEEQQQQQ